MTYQSGFVFGDSQSNTSSCLKAVEDVTYQVPNIAVATATGAALTNIKTVASGGFAGFGGQVDNRGNCFNLLLTVQRLIGSDCDTCTINTLTPVTKTYFVKKGDVFNLPGAFWSQVDYQVADDTQAPVNTPVPGSFNFYSSYVPACPSCAIVVGGNEPLGRFAATEKTVTETKKV